MYRLSENAHCCFHIWNCLLGDEMIEWVHFALEQPLSQLKRRRQKCHQQARLPRFASVQTFPQRSDYIRSLNRENFGGHKYGLTGYGCHYIRLTMSNLLLVLSAIAALASGQTCTSSSGLTWSTSKGNVLLNGKPFVLKGK